MTIDLNPPAYPSTPIEDQLALLQFYTENEFTDIIFSFDCFYNDRNYKLSEIQEIQLRHDTDDFLSVVKPYEFWWEEAISNCTVEDIKDYLSEEHAGDCVALPCSCMRCWAENNYGIPATATWGKSAGSRAWYAKHDKRSIFTKFKYRMRSKFYIYRNRLKRYFEEKK